MTALFIRMDQCCPDGFSLAVRRVDAYNARNHDEWLKIAALEKEHLDICPICSGELFKGLWPQGQVQEG